MGDRASLGFEGSLVSYPLVDNKVDGSETVIFSQLSQLVCATIWSRASLYNILVHMSSIFTNEGAIGCSNII